MITSHRCLFTDWPPRAGGKEVGVSPEARLKPKCFTSDLNHSGGFLLLSVSLLTESRLPGLVKPV